MALSYTIHTTDCGSAQGWPVATPDEYPDARKHRCIYYMDPLPENVRVTSVEGEIPPAPPE